MNNFEDHIVVFIDFLGFKNFNQEKSILERREFISFLQQIKALDSDVVVQGESGNKQFRLASSFYSDSLVLGWPINQPELTVDQSVIMTAILPLISQIAIRALCFGLLIRGAITVGEFYHKNGIFLGKAFDDGYYLESEIAIYPRIIISNEIFEKNLILTPLEQDIPNCFKPWLKDFDHINYLNYFFLSSFRQSFFSCVHLPRDEKLLDEKVREWIASCSKIVNKNISTYSSGASKNIKHLQKWNWFSDYFKKSIISLSENASWTGVDSRSLAPHSTTD